MVQFIAAAAIGGIAYVAYTSFRRHWDALQREELEKARKPKQSGVLEKDPETGRYKVRGDED